MTYIHLDGGIYYYNKELNLVTIDDISDPKIEEAVIDYREGQFDWLRERAYFTKWGLEETDLEMSVINTPVDPGYTLISWKTGKEYSRTYDRSDGGTGEGE